MTPKITRRRRVDRAGVLGNMTAGGELVGSLRPARRLDDDALQCDAYLTKCGIFRYLEPNGSIRRELRRPTDVFAPESLRSAECVPVTNDHPNGLLDENTVEDHAVGVSAGPVTRDTVRPDHVKSSITVWGEDAKEALASGKVQLSCGYECDCLETPGTDPVHGRYDAIQTNIKYNHVAIVDCGRAGPTCAVRMDAGVQIEDDDE